MKGRWNRDMVAAGAVREPLLPGTPLAPLLRPVILFPLT